MTNRLTPVGVDGGGFNSPSLVGRIHRVVGIAPFADVDPAQRARLPVKRLRSKARTDLRAAWPTLLKPFLRPLSWP